MPRKSRSQPGPSGGSYSNRSDLSQPVQAPTGLPYGQNQALEQAQAAAPLPQAQDPFEGALQAAQQMEFSPVPLNAPSSRPFEPVTSGLVSGAGPGPEALGPQTGLSAAIERAIAQTGGSDVFQMLLERARQMGL